MLTLPKVMFMIDRGSKLHFIAPSSLMAPHTPHPCMYADVGEISLKTFTPSEPYPIAISRPQVCGDTFSFSSLTYPRVAMANTAIKNTRPAIIDITHICLPASASSPFIVGCRVTTSPLALVPRINTLVRQGRYLGAFLTV